ncbi:MAG: DNA mismatch repair protein MutS [Chloroflexota bacterium]|nr:DNA mismatch repair protein MutS [Chloroflexota bacterium]
MDGLTPIRRQYLDVKRRYPHAIVFFRLGDFYETFDDDAELCARELAITLTSKPMGKGLRVPLAGIPYHAVEGYLAKLIAKGYKVAICEQMSDPATAKGLVERAVTRVVTPGTVVEGSLLDERANNYLACLAPGRPRRGGEPWAGGTGLAYVDISTGEFVAGELTPEQAQAELGRIGPAEVLLPDGVEPPPWLDAGLRVTRVEPLWFDGDLAEVTLIEQMRVASPEAYGLAKGSPAVAACGAVLLYLRENQAASAGLITSLRAHQPEEYAGLDAHTLRNLEVFTAGRDLRRDGSLLATLDLTSTSMGARLLRRRLGQPLRDIAAIGRRLDAVSYCHESALVRARLVELLRGVGDIERLMSRVVAGSAQPRELVALRRGLEAGAALRAALGAPGAPQQTTDDRQQSDGAAQQTTQTGRTADDRRQGAHGALRAGGDAPPCDRRIAGIAARMHACEDAVTAIAQAIDDEPGPTVEAGNVVRAGFSAELDGLRLIRRDVRRFLAELEAGERERTGIKSLKIGYNRVFGYYIEVSKANVGLVPEHYERRQSLVNGERYATPQLREYESQIRHAEERSQEIEASLFRQVCAQVAASSARILETAQAVAELDVACALAEAASRYGYVRPQVDAGDAIEVRDGRHPMVERSLAAGAFVPNDADLSSGDAQIVILTGPNMAGKSTFLRQVALIVLMAQCGSFVPASSARIGVVDRIFTRVGAGDDLTSGQSTFMVEMIETSAILHNATSRSLLILDEIGRGTSTYDGMAIARAVVEYLHNRPGLEAKTLFATHYHELVDLAQHLPRVRNYNVAVAEEEGRIVLLRRIVPGGADRSYGVHVAELAGLPRAVVQRAREVLIELERGTDGRGPKRSAAAPQLPLIAPEPREDPLRAELAALDVNAMTPLDALNRLYELRERARSE